MSKNKYYFYHITSRVEQITHLDQEPIRNRHLGYVPGRSFKHRVSGKKVPRTYLFGYGSPIWVP